MKKSSFYISLVFIFLSFALFFFFRQTPKGDLWKGYSVLYVSSEAGDDEVKKSLNQFGITDFVCLSNQFLPTVLNADSAEISLLNYNVHALDYLEKRNNYFFDKSHEYKLYYIPVENKSKLVACVNYLNKNNVFSGVDTSTSYPILLPVFVFVFLALLLVFSKNRLLFLSSSVLTFVYSLCFPYLSSCVSSLLLLLVLFACLNYYKRRGAKNLLSRKLIFFLLVFTGVFSSFTATITSGLMFVLLLAGTFSSYMAYDFVSGKFQKKTSFNPVLIRSARFIPQFAGKERVIFPVCLVLICLSFSVSILSIDSLALTSSSVSLPSSNATVHSDNLPDLSDYAKWDFIVKTFPYRSINEKSDFLDDVSFYKYSNSGENIVETKETLAFDSDFIDNSIGQIDKLNFDSIEKILKRQDSDFVSGYSVSGSQHLSIFSIILVVAQLLFLLFYYVKTVFRIHRGKK